MPRLRAQDIRALPGRTQTRRTSVSASTPLAGVRRFPDSDTRCDGCGLRIAQWLADRGATAHILCTSLSPDEYDRRYLRTPLRLVQGGVR